MSDAPEMIALRWELGAAVTSGYLMNHPDYTLYQRADLAPDPALFAEVVEALRECRDALRDHGKQYPHMVKGYTLDAENRANAILAKLEARDGT